MCPLVFNERTLKKISLVNLKLQVTVITKQQIMLNYAEGSFTVYKLTQLNSTKRDFSYVVISIRDP